MPLFIVFFGTFLIFFVGFLSIYFILFLRKFFGLFVTNFFLNKFYFDMFGSKVFSKLFLIISYRDFFKYIDRGLFEVIGPTGLVKVARLFFSFFLNIQSGYVYQYMFVSLYGLVFVLFFVFFIF